MLTLFTRTMLSALLILMTISSLQAEEPKGTVSVGPQQLASARKVFILNGGTEASNCFTGGPDRHYRQFYTAMKNWGRYELVKTAADADLIFDLRLNAPTFKCTVENGPGAPAFNLAILDSRNHVGLWALTEQVKTAGKQKRADENFDLAVNRLVENVKQLVEQRQ